jgi:hypothetical protein
MVFLVTNGVIHIGCGPARRHIGYYGTAFQSHISQFMLVYDLVPTTVHEQQYVEHESTSVSDSGVH